MAKRIPVTETPAETPRELTYGPEILAEPPQPETAGPLEPSPLTQPAANGALVPRRPTQPLTMDTPITECPTSLDLQSARGRALAFAAGNPADYAFDGDKPVQITAFDWLIYPDETTDAETGEVRQFARVVLFDRLGRFFKTTSQFAPRRLQAAVQLFTPEDWRRGVTFIVSQRRGKLGRTYHDIRVLVDEE
jgi:hypothetical protein